MAARHRLICGDVFEELEKLEDESFDAIVSDPPYGFPGGFMSRGWDNLGDAEKAMQWHRRWLELALPKLRSGGRVLAASGSRVFQRLAFAAELAGLVVDPAFFWINGSSMAQGLAIDKAIDKAAGAEREVVGAYESPEGTTGWKSQDRAKLYGESNLRDGEPREITAPATPLAALFEGYSTRLKDAVCPWLMAHRAPDGTWAQNAERHGLAGLDVDGGRVPTDWSTDPTRRGWQGGNSVSRRHGATTLGDKMALERVSQPSESGRYPSNLALSPEAAEELGRQSGELHSWGKRERDQVPDVNSYGSSRGGGISVHPDGDSGTASRFFHTFRYQAKTGPAERLKGCESFFWRVSRDHPLGFERITQAEYLAMGHLPGCRPRRRSGRPDGAHRSTVTAYGDASGEGLAVLDLPLLEILAAELEELPEPGCAEGCQHRQRYQGNPHPTLKPIELIKYLAKLVLPPDTGRPRRVLVLFAGTYSEVIGCDLAGWDEVVGIEAEPVYVEIGEARRRAWVQETAEQLQLTV